MKITKLYFLLIACCFPGYFLFAESNDYRINHDFNEANIGIIRDAFDNPVENCGFRAGYDALFQLYKNEKMVDELRGKVIEGGFLRISSLTLTDIGSAMEAYSCVYPVKNVSLKCIFQVVNSSAVAILYLKDNKFWPNGHYVVIAGADNGRVRVLDGKDSIIDVKYEDLILRIGSAFKHNALILCRNDIDAISRAKILKEINDSPDEFDLADEIGGQIIKTNNLVDAGVNDTTKITWRHSSLRPSLIEGHLTIKNPLGLDADSYIVKGECSCFSGYESAMPSVKKDCDLDLTLFFNIYKIKQTQKTQVAIIFKAKNRQQPVLVKVNIAGADFSSPLVLSSDEVLWNQNISGKRELVVLKRRYLFPAGIESNPNDLAVKVYGGQFTATISSCLKIQIREVDYYSYVINVEPNGGVNGITDSDYIELVWAGGTQAVPIAYKHVF